MLVLTTLSGTASAQMIEQNTAAQVGPVTKVIYQTGYFEKNANGDWDEFFTNGTLRYPFRETRTTRDSVFLRNDTLQVDIEMNMATGEIWAEWPGQFRHMMHKISNVKNEAPEPPAALPPVIAPPVISTPPEPPAPSENNMAILSVSYNGGKLAPVGQQWADYRDDSDAVHLYDVLAQSDREVYLHSETSGRFYRISVWRQKLLMASNGGPLKLHSAITDMSAVSANPPSIPPQVSEPSEPKIPGRLTQSEIADCVQSLGKIERAGFLGAERCTRPYSDGGKSCTDSAQCEGQCRAPSMNMTDQTVVGVCQMDDNPFGCHAQVRGGVAEPALCVD